MSDLTPGDPLNPGSDAPRTPRAPEAPFAPPQPPVPPGSPYAPDAPSGYGSGPVPPGAGGTPPTFAPPPPPPPGALQLAGWGARAGATVIDGVILFVLAAFVFLPMVALGLSVDTDGGAAAFIGFFLLVTFAWFIANLLYAPVMMARTNGQTIGKQALGIRVVRTNGQAMDFSWAALREVAVKSLLVGVASSATFGLAWLADVLWPLIDPENRALHDFVVQTRVVKA